MQVQMESNDLESFFLNKDKKKKNKKLNIINPALLLEQTREAEIKKAKKVTEKSQQSQEPKSDLLRKTKEDDEWEDNPDIEVDISNLRIGVMPQKIEEVKPKPETVECKSDESDSDNNSKKVEKPSHPWGNKTSVKPESVEVLASTNEQALSQKYLPPNLRSGDTKGALKQFKKAPNISNSTEFPSLREVVVNDSEDGTWCKVTKNGHTQQQEPQQNTKKYIPVMKRDTASNDNLPIIQQQPPTSEKVKPEKLASKYVPPHLRNKPNVNSNENRFASLKDESLN